MAHGHDSVCERVKVIFCACMCVLSMCVCFIFLCQQFVCVCMCVLKFVLNSAGDRAREKECYRFLAQPC